MNERIKELASDARGKMIVLNTVDDELWSQDQEFCEKFAELIVRECVKTIANDTANWQGDEGQMAYYQGVQDAVKSIRNHFGVEE